MPEHTPGPWMARGRFVLAVTDECPDYDPLIIADCRVETDEGEANATLITAAPEMLQALQAVARLHPGCDIRRTNITHSDACAQVQSAIAKATGGIDG